MHIKATLIALALCAPVAPSDVRAAGGQTEAAMLPVCSVGHRAQRKVTCVHDGDTFWLTGVKYRLACVDAHELDEPGGVAARDFLRRALARPGARVLDTGVKGGYRRPLVRVFIGRVSVGDSMIAAGLARFGSYRNVRKFCGVRP